jgi:hypothetical protein
MPGAANCIPVKRGEGFEEAIEGRRQANRTVEGDPDHVVANPDKGVRSPSSREGTGKATGYRPARKCEMRRKRQFSGRVGSVRLNQYRHKSLLICDLRRSFVAPHQVSEKYGKNGHNSLT